VCVRRGRIRQADPLFVYFTSRGQVLGESSVLRRIPSRLHPIWNSCGDDVHRIRILFSVFPDEKLAKPCRPCHEARDGKSRGICSAAHPNARCVLATWWMLFANAAPCQVCGNLTPSTRSAYHRCVRWIRSSMLHLNVFPAGSLSWTRIRHSPHLISSVFKGSPVSG